MSNKALLVGTDSSHSEETDSGERILRVGIEEDNVLSETEADTISLLSDVLKELKKITLHLSFMTDITVKNTEV